MLIILQIHDLIDERFLKNSQRHVQPGRKDLLPSNGEKPSQIRGPTEEREKKERR